MTHHFFQLLAATSQFNFARQWRWWKRHYAEYLDPTVLSLLAIAIIGMIVIWILRRRQQRSLAIIDDQTQLFRELCRAHRLSWRQRSLLRSVAKQANVGDACEVFIEPRHLKTAATNEKYPSVRTRIVKLQTQLFGS